MLFLLSATISLNREWPNPVLLKQPEECNLNLPVWDPRVSVLFFPHISSNCKVKQSDETPENLFITIQILSSLSELPALCNIQIMVTFCPELHFKSAIKSLISW